MKLKKNSLLILLIMVGVIATYALYIFVVVPYSDKRDKEKQAELDQQCYAQIENQTDHDVSIFMYGHENEQVKVLEYQISARHLLKIRQDMNKEEYNAFPPKGMMDSVLFVYDDTLQYWQTPETERGSIGERHTLYERYYWKWCKIVVQGRTRSHQEFYRSGLEFTLTERDYERALGIKRYDGLIMRENN